ncbi:MAG: ADP-ribosylglycohydrolase family protein [Armatimonadia bacterium]|nr:ADP-ribosylglycohydrolase family protein [Armatimonadia bacterium]
MNLNAPEYRTKVLGCWLGKNIGGTLGAPFEWRRQINDVSFYTQDLGGEPLPNDDLDIQLLWLVALEEMGPDLDAHALAEYWLLYVTPHWCEYGNAKINLQTGLMPPLSGSLNNPYKHSCGCFIRSEIWGCVAPGCPDVAARYAYEDGILDHGDGEGLFGEVFCAALESAAFVQGDLRELIDIGLSYIPGDCGIARAVRQVIDSYDSGMPWRDARDRLLGEFRGSTHMGYEWCTSEEDRAKGFHEGELGWDAPSNVALVVLGLLYGEGDFASTLCTTVNCGEDTDCTAATVGAIWGIIHGAEAIPEEWIEPIGRTIKTACLNLGELGFLGNQLPQNVDDLTARTEAMARQVLGRIRRGIALSDAPTDLAGLPRLAGHDRRQAPYSALGGTRHRFAFFDVVVDYGGDPSLKPGQARSVTLKLTNRYKIPATLRIKWYLPEGIEIDPAPFASVHVKQAPFPCEGSVAFHLSTEEPLEGPIRAAVEITRAGHAEVMVVPVVLTG